MEKIINFWQIFIIFIIYLFIYFRGQVLNYQNKASYTNSIYRNSFSYQLTDAGVFSCVVKSLSCVTWEHLR